MKHFTCLIFVCLCINSVGCKRSVKDHNDDIYSRHLQRHVALTIITTPLPEKKEEMNLLLFNGKNYLQEVRVKQILDSLYKKNLIQPLIVVAFDGTAADYGMQETETTEAKQHKKFNEFVVDELYPFVKKKVTVRKFDAVAICGFYQSAISAFDIAWNNDEKIQKAGMFYPVFYESETVKDSALIAQIQSLRKRPTIKLWLTYTLLDNLNIMAFKKVIETKKSIENFQPVTSERNLKKEPAIENFADFLVWAFAR